MSPTTPSGFPEKAYLHWAETAHAPGYSRAKTHDEPVNGATRGYRRKLVEELSRRLELDSPFQDLAEDYLRRASERAKQADKADIDALIEKLRTEPYVEWRDVEFRGQPVRRFTNPNKKDIARLRDALNYVQSGMLLLQHPDLKTDPASVLRKVTVDRGASQSPLKDVYKLARHAQMYEMPSPDAVTRAWTEHRTASVRELFEAPEQGPGTVDNAGAFKHLADPTLTREPFQPGELED